MTALDPGRGGYSAAPGLVPSWNALAIVAFVLAFVVPPGAILCGHLARGQIRRTGEQGDGLALAALILGSVFTGVIVLFVLLWIGIMASSLLTVLVVLFQTPSGGGV